MPDSAYKALNRGMGQVIHKYNLISDGDRIAVAVSGGMDSLTLMWFLQERLSRIRITYQLFPIYIDMGFDGGFSELLKDYFTRTGYPIRIEYTDYGVISHSEANRENPCFLCSRLRRKRLFEIADELGANKIALGHNKDDIIETLFLNIFYSGEISTMIPAQPMFKGHFTLIRPLAFADEETIRKFANQQGFPVFVNPCPSSRDSKRREIKLMLHQLYKSNRKIKGNIFRAMSRYKPEYLL